MKDDLDKFEMLGELSTEDREGLVEFLEERRLDAGSLLFQVGQEADEMFFLVEGMVRIEVEGRVLGHMLPGEVIGVVSLVQISRRECDAVGQDECRLLTLSRERYHRMRADLPAAALALQEGILRSFAGHVRVALADRRREADPI